MSETIEYEYYNTKTDVFHYNQMLKDMRAMEKILTKKYQIVLPGSPTLASVMKEYKRLYPEDSDCQKANNIGVAFEQLNMAISSNPKRYEDFLMAVR